MNVVRIKSILTVILAGGLSWGTLASSLPTAQLDITSTEESYLASIDDMQLPEQYSEQETKTEPPKAVVLVDQINQKDQAFTRKFESYPALIKYASMNLEVNPAQVADELIYALQDPELTQAEDFELRLLLAKTYIERRLIEKTTDKVKELHDVVEMPQQRLAVFKIQFELAKAKNDLSMAVQTLEDALEFAELSISENASKELEIERGNWYQKAASLYLEYGQFDKANDAIHQAIEIAERLEQLGAVIERRQFLAESASANDDQYLARLAHQRLVTELESKNLFLLANQQRIEWARLLISERIFVDADALLEKAFEFGQTMRNRSLQLESLTVLIDSQLKQFNDEYARELLTALDKLQKLPNAFGFDLTKQSKLRAEIIRLRSLMALRLGLHDQAFRVIYTGQPVDNEQRIQYALLKKQIVTAQGQWQKADTYQQVADFLIQKNKSDVLARHDAFLKFENAREKAALNAHLSHQNELINDLTVAVVKLKQRLSGALWLLVGALALCGFFYVTRRPKPKY